MKPAAPAARSREYFNPLRGPGTSIVSCDHSKPSRLKQAPKLSDQHPFQEGDPSTPLTVLELKPAFERSLLFSGAGPECLMLAVSLGEALCNTGVAGLDLTWRSQPCNMDDARSWRNWSYADRAARRQFLTQRRRHFKEERIPRLQCAR